MKRSKLYSRLISAYNAELKRTNREIESLNRQANQTIGSAKVRLDERRQELWKKKLWLDKEIRQAYQIKKRAKKGELYWENVTASRMPEGYVHPSDVR